MSLRSHLKFQGPLKPVGIDLGPEKRERNRISSAESSNATVVEGQTDIADNTIEIGKKVFFRKFLI